MEKKDKKKTIKLVFKKSSVGLEKECIVQYIVNGFPLFHSKEDIQTFCFITSNFIHQGLHRKAVMA